MQIFTIKNMQDFFQIISNFGFPVAVASYLLLRFEKKLDALEIANEEKIRKIEILTGEIADLKGEIEDLNQTIKYNIKTK